jgi:hypothetical protein
MMGGEVGANRPRMRQRAANMRRAPQLEGLAQIIGLALGSPEFQRR